MEVLLYSDGSGQSSNINVIEIPNGQSVTAFKEGAASCNTLCCLREDYVISAVPNKSVLNVFEMNRRSQASQKVVTPGIVKTLCISMDGCYIAAGIEERVLVWDSISGELLSTLCRHYQDVTSLCFSSDSSFLVSSGLDGMIAVWDTSEFCDVSADDRSKETLFCWASHTLPVTHLYCGSICASRSRVFSSSLDRTIKIHDLGLGSILLTIVFATGITRFCVDLAETFLVAGGYDGSLCKIDLIFIAKKASELHTTSVNINLDNEHSEKTVSNFLGHKKAISCLACNIDASLFVSGSEDTTVRLWDISSGQCIRSINAKSGITNLMLTVSTQRLSSTTCKPLYAFPKLARVSIEVGSEESPKKICRLDLQLKSKSQNVETKLQKRVESCLAKGSQDDGTNLQSLKKEVNVLRHENKKLYDFALSGLLPC